MTAASTPASRQPFPASPARAEVRTLLGLPSMAPGAPPARVVPTPAAGAPPAVAARVPQDTPPPMARRPPSARLATAHAFGPGDLVSGRWRLERRLADGGMGGVWAAKEEATGRDVVVKLMSVELRNDDDAVRRFEQEAQAVASVQSPHIVELVDHGVLAGAPYMVLERLRGEDLAQRLSRGPLPLAECATILEQMASALRVAHQAGIIHRDIKPANIFIADVGEGENRREVAKLLDFGVAKLTNQARIRTKAGITIGSPHFMSPEQVQGLPDLDGRSDLFALAGVVYTCATGTMPFFGSDLADTFQRILRHKFEPPSQVVSDLPATLDAFFERALAVEPENRFATAAEMAQAFRAIVDGQRGVTTMRTASQPPPAGTSRSARPSFDPPALRGFGAKTQAELRAHLVAPLARARAVDPIASLDRRSVAYAAAAILSMVVTAGAVWQVL